MQLLPMALGSPGVARRQLVVDLRTEAVDTEVGDDALLVLSELVTNAVRHGSPIPSPLGAGLGVEWAISGSDVTLGVADAGKGPPAPAGGATAWWSGESGRGLGIVAGLCADWGVRPFVDEQLGRGPCGVLVWGRLSR